MNKEEVGKLVEKFSREESRFRRSDYNETQVRREFIDPLFGALGWDVGDSRVVKHEDVTTVRETDGNRTKKHPDYGFYLNGTLRFYVEAKKPAVNLLASPEYAYQVRRYGWSANLPACVLTDFEELLIYDCRIRPDYNDAATVARKKVYRFTEYQEKWDEIVALLSPEGVANNSLLALVGDSRGSISVDNAFLQEIEAWREALAKDIAKRNPNLGTRALNTVVQNTIDRIVFLRICEDREIEPYGRLENAAKTGSIYESLKQQFLEAQDKFNSGLFDFRATVDEAGDPYSLNVEIGDASLRRILNSIYYPESPYEFSVLPTDLLGQVYERFLGKVIEVASGNAQIVEKPEVRKAGGVYYTPKQIVQYIVQQTVGRLVEGKTPKEVSNLRILDPACGSGSFLIGAYDFLLEWHREYYATHQPSKFKNEVRKTVEDNWVLTTDEKRRILLNNLFGVDLDPQAVEVTKLSLLLKMLEGETASTAQMKLLRTSDKLLPDLGTNIKWGNSLVESDYYEGKQLALFEDEAILRMKAFDWNDPSGFASIMREGGFDAVIGNPPYIDSEWMSVWHPQQRLYCSTHFSSAAGNWDIFCVFVERALQLCKNGGYSSMIVPNKLASAEYARSIRKIIFDVSNLVAIRDYSRVPVFPVAVYPIIFVAQKLEANHLGKVALERMEGNSAESSRAVHLIQIDGNRLGGSGEAWRIFGFTHDTDLIERLKAENAPLAKVATVLGAATVDEAYRLTKLFSEGSPNSRNVLRIVNSGTIDRYEFLWEERPMRYLKQVIPMPIVLKEHQELLPSKRLEQARSPKIIVAGMTKYLECGLDYKGEFLAAKSTSVVIPHGVDIFYLVGLLNSKLISFYYTEEHGGNRLSGGYLRIGPPQLRQIPIRVVESGDEVARTNQDIIVSSVKQILQLIEDRKSVQGEARKLINVRIRRLEGDIDRAVYALYNLSDEEVHLINNSTKS